MTTSTKSNKMTPRAMSKSKASKSRVVSSSAGPKNLSTSKAAIRKIAVASTTNDAVATKATSEQMTPDINAGPALLRKKELIDNAVRRSGIKKKDAKPVVDALLAELGEAIAQGRGLALPPLGRIKINRQKELDDGRVTVLKLRQKDQYVKNIDAKKTPE